MKFFILILLVLSSFIWLSCFPADNTDEKLMKNWEGYNKGSEPEFFNLPDYSSSQLKYDRKNKIFHRKYFKKIKEEFEKELEENERICNQNSINKNSLKFQNKWKKRGQSLLNELVNFDPLGRSSALYQVYFRLIRYMSQGITGSVYLKCENDPGYTTEKDRFRKELKKIENYLYLLSQQ